MTLPRFDEVFDFDFEDILVVFLLFAKRCILFFSLFLSPSSFLVVSRVFSSTESLRFVLATFASSFASSGRDGGFGAIVCYLKMFSNKTELRGSQH